MKNVKKHFEILGLAVKDKITGFAGIATSLSFDLYGCIMVLVHGGMDKDCKMLDQLWFDIARMEVLDDTPVMPRPDFEFGYPGEGKKGPSEKPRHMKP
jgi:hypothetical protein